MEGWQIALIVKPLVLLALFAPGAAIAWLMRKRIPDGKLKRILFFSWRV